MLSCSVAMVITSDRCCNVSDAMPRRLTMVKLQIRLADGHGSASHERQQGGKEMGGGYYCTVVQRRRRRVELGLSWHRSMTMCVFSPTALVQYISLDQFSPFMPAGLTVALCTISQPPLSRSGSMYSLRLACRGPVATNFNSLSHTCKEVVRQPHTPRCFTTTRPSLADEPRSVPINERANDTAHKYRKFMMEKPLNPHMTNTSSTIANEFPSLGQDKPPAEMLTSLDPNYVPKDSVPKNTEKMTGGTQPGGPDKGPNAELNVGEMEGSKVKIEPNRRAGENEDTLRARLLCPLDFSLSLLLHNPPTNRNAKTVLLTQSISLNRSKSQKGNSRV